MFDLTTGRYLENHRRCVCQSRFHDHLAQSVRVHCGGAGGGQPACESRPIAGADRRSRFQGGARPSERGCPRCRSRGTQPRYAASLATANHRTEYGRHRRRSNREYGRRCPSRTALYPFEILSNSPPGPVQKQLAFAVVRRNASSMTTQRALFLQGTVQPGDFPWTRTF
jgi:hypothetical protein